MKWIWQAGRQNTGYEKLCIISKSWFDVYILRFKPGSSIPKHRDPILDKIHLRMNVILKHAKEGGEFRCSKCILNWSRLKIFRPDKFKHSVTEVTLGTRYVLSIGIAL